MGATPCVVFPAWGVLALHGRHAQGAALFFFTLVQKEEGMLDSAAAAVKISLEILPPLVKKVRIFLRDHPELWESLKQGIIKPLALATMVFSAPKANTEGIPADPPAAGPSETPPGTPDPPLPEDETVLAIAAILQEMAVLREDVQSAPARVGECVLGALATALREERW